MKLSIVIATYQRKDGSTPRLLTRALDSIFSQTYQNFKIYLIGDRYENNDEFNKNKHTIFDNAINIDLINI
jgi:glycosyltransferase involved in cell wall biosynthesis